MRTHIISGLVRGIELPIAMATKMETQFSEITIEAITDTPEELMNIMVIGLQYYEFSMFSMLIEVIADDTSSHHFMFDSWIIREQCEEIMQPLLVDNPYLHFNEHVREHLLK